MSQVCPPPSPLSLLLSLLGYPSLDDDALEAPPDGGGVALIDNIVVRTNVCTSAAKSGSVILGSASTTCLSLPGYLFSNAWMLVRATALRTVGESYDIARWREVGSGGYERREEGGE